MRISDWSSDVCSSALVEREQLRHAQRQILEQGQSVFGEDRRALAAEIGLQMAFEQCGDRPALKRIAAYQQRGVAGLVEIDNEVAERAEIGVGGIVMDRDAQLDRRHQRADFLRSEEHTSELPSLMRISYAVF